MPFESTHDQPTALYFGYTTVAPDLASVEVKTVHPESLLGEPAVFTVIGESHYVGIPTLDFHELCSCKPLSSETTHETPLSVGVDHAFDFESEQLHAQTVVEGRPLDHFPGAGDATVAYRFGPDAWTTIHATDAGYETYHTYPEYELALYTETRLTLNPSETAEFTAQTAQQTTTPNPRR